MKAYSPEKSPKYDIIWGYTEKSVSQRLNRYKKIQM